jgi:1-acyl-sn-glycerol-3-phosphate acyltransferase
VTVPFYTVALFKWIIPIRSWRVFCSWLLHRIGDVWIYLLNTGQGLFTKTRCVTRGLESLNINSSCLLMVNHQTWIDIMILVKLFYRRIPDFKIFVKIELLWLPIIGQAFWAVDFPIMNRNSSRNLERTHLKTRTGKSPGGNARSSRPCRYPIQLCVAHDLRTKHLVQNRRFPLLSRSRRPPWF